MWKVNIRVCNAKGKSEWLNADSIANSMCERVAQTGSVLGLLSLKCYMLFITTSHPLNSPKTNLMNNQKSIVYNTKNK